MGPRTRGQLGRRERKRKESADKPGSVVDNHSSAIRVTAYLKRPTRESVWATHATQPKLNRALPYLVLLQAGFTVPPSVTTGAVRSYRTISPLPARGRGHALRRFAFCCTFRGLTSPRCYLAPCPGSPDFPPPLQARAAVVWPTPPLMIQKRAESSGRSYATSPRACRRSIAWRERISRRASLPSISRRFSRPATVAVLRAKCEGVDRR